MVWPSETCQGVDDWVSACRGLVVERARGRGVGTTRSVAKKYFVAIGKIRKTWFGPLV